MSFYYETMLTKRMISMCISDVEKIKNVPGMTTRGILPLIVGTSVCWCQYVYSEQFNTPPASLHTVYFQVKL